ncbi:MAG: hypothetical protein GX575_30645 [Candidatus Anammoximicrobium sp.]|nr:hypothetical protein [Candidatus Anammoximicrobium sp.]
MMEMRNDHGTLPIVELLGVEAATLTDPEQTATAPVVFLTFRPEPHESWRSFSFPVSLQHAIRLRNDLTAALQRYQAATQAK